MQPSHKGVDYPAKKNTATEMGTALAREIPKAAPPAELDPESLAAIRSLLTENLPGQPEARSTAKPAACTDAPDYAVANETPSDIRRTARKANSFPKIEHITELPEHTAKASIAKAKRTRMPGSRFALEGKLDSLKARVKEYRPTPRQIVLASLALIVFFRPWLVLGLLFLGMFVLLGVFLILGYDGFWRRAMGVGRWHARRHPERSVELHQKLDAFAMKWDAILDRFPEGSVDGLYLPDFGEIAEADARHDAAMGRRLDSLRESEANA